MASSISLSARLPLALLVRPAGVSRGGDAWRALVDRMGSGLWSGTACPASLMRYDPNGSEGEGELSDG